MLAKDVNMINVSMVDKAYQELVEPSKVIKKWNIKEDITFFKEDTAGIQYPHVDAIVIILNLDNYNIYHVLVDSGCAIDILYFLAFSRMKLSVDLLAKYGSLI